MNQISLLTVTFLGISAAICVGQEETKQLAPIVRDYTYSPGGDDRVPELVGFFESLRNFNIYDPELRESQIVAIPLNEAASKLHRLMDGFRLDDKCNKYFKLIKRPNIRTVGEVNLLAREDNQFYEKFQSDANVISRLTDERTFDALGRIQTIAQALETEKENLQSTFEPIVYKELLDCINYFIYRHQKALTGLPEFTRESLSNLPAATVQNSPSELALKESRELIDRINFIESDESSSNTNRTLDWLDELLKLGAYVEDNKLEIPAMIRNFVSNPKRIERLRECDLVLRRADQLKRQITDLESNDQILLDSERRKVYDELYDELEELVDARGDLLQSKLGSFISRRHQLAMSKSVETSANDAIVPTHINRLQSSKSRLSKRKNTKAAKKSKSSHQSRHKRKFQ